LAFQKVAIVGTGLIGTSLGMALKRLNPPPQIIGCDLRGDARRAASGQKAVDRATGNVIEAVREADLVMVATPVRAMELIFQEIALVLRPGTVVTDTGSTKRDILDWAAEHLPESVSFIGGHPMTGRLTAGVGDADPAIFHNAVYCIAPLTSADSQAVERMVKLVEAIGCVPYFVEPDEHDGLVAGISHLPYVLSAALMRCVATDRGWREARTVAAGGFATATQLSDADPRMFGDICLTNREQIARQIDRFTAELEEMRSLIVGGDESIYHRLEDAQRLHLEWLAGRGADEAPNYSTEDLKPQSLFFPAKLGEILRRGEKK
jgi:prephenate dehydrogenase